MNDQWLKDAVNKIEAKVDKLDGRLDNVDVTLGKQAVVLEEHHKRSLSNEANLDLLRAEFKPVEKHVEMMNTMFKAVGMVASGAGAILGSGKLLEVILSYFSK